MRARLNEFLSDLLVFSLSASDVEGFITSPTGNFREALATYAPYKGNRSGAKPEHYDYIRQYLKEDWGFHESIGHEADDDIAMAATYLGDDAIICSIDKDLDQVAGWHYNFVKKKLYYVTPEQGLRNFYTQLLTGDRIDNIVGLKKVGPVRAAKILGDASTPEELYLAVSQAYYDHGEEHWRLVENARLLWLKRSPQDCWCPPVSMQDIPTGS